MDVGDDERGLLLGAGDGGEASGEDRTQGMVGAIEPEGEAGMKGLEEAASRFPTGAGGPVDVAAHQGVGQGVPVGLGQDGTHAVAIMLALVVAGQTKGAKGGQV